MLNIGKGLTNAAIVKNKIEAGIQYLQYYESLSPFFLSTGQSIHAKSLIFNPLRHCNLRLEVGSDGKRGTMNSFNDTEVLTAF